MQRKTIIKNITSKLEDWLQSIKDESLSKDVKKSLLLSGGSITSMFLNEPVNDFDIYLKDMGVLKRLVHYYSDPHGIEVFDGRKTYLESSSSSEDISQRTVAIRTLKKEQIKLFTSSGGNKIIHESKGDEVLDKYLPIFFSPNAISLSDNIQIVCRFSGTPEEIHSTFDFMHATNYFTFEDGLVTNTRALESILSKQLLYQGSKYPVTSVIRSKKFIKRGWNISAGEYLKMAMQVSELDLTDPDVLEEQSVGVDVAYFSTLIEVLRNIKGDEKLNSSYVSEIIDRIFQENSGEDV